MAVKFNGYKSRYLLATSKSLEDNPASVRPRDFPLRQNEALAEIVPSLTACDKNRPEPLSAVRLLRTVLLYDNVVDSSNCRVMWANPINFHCFTFCFLYLFYVGLLSYYH